LERHGNDDRSSPPLPAALVAIIVGTKRTLSEQRILSEQLLLSEPLTLSDLHGSQLERWLKSIIDRKDTNERPGAR
jgi:hypothetical protein